MNKDIYSLGLHEQAEISTKFMKYLLVTRVPGGWLYSAFNETTPGVFAQSDTFVPFHNDFQLVPPP